MSFRRVSTSIAGFAVLAAAACSDGSGTAAPRMPEVPVQGLGLIRGTVAGTTMTAEFEPMGAAGGAISDWTSLLYEIGNDGGTC